MKTVFANAQNARRDWLVVDAAGKNLGRLSTAIAMRLRGKHKAIFTPHADAGDNIIVVNAEKIAVTGNKLTDKRYYKHSKHPGGLRVRTAAEVLNTRPERVLEAAVHGMLPKNPLGKSMFSKLKVYGGAEHPHQAQNPVALPTQF